MKASKNKYRLADNSFEVSDFHVKIMVIGYGCCGESTLILLMDGELVFYSIVIDSYHYKENRSNFKALINKTADILEEYNVGRLDILCWTHPHDDQSKGIPRLISKYCDDATWVVFPLYLQNNPADIVKYGVVSKCNLRFIYLKNKEHKALATPIGIPDYGVSIIDDFQIKDVYSSSVVACIKVGAITPISSRLSEFVNASFCSDPNELSVSIVVDINGYGLFLGSDTKNNHIERANDEIMKRCRFVKIPHHSSPTAIKLTEHLPAELDAVCTTVFKWGKTSLPNNNVLRKYRQFKVDIYSTNKAICSSIYPYGIVEYDYDFSQGIPIVSATSSGNGGVI